MQAGCLLHLWGGKARQGSHLNWSSVVYTGHVIVFLIWEAGYPLTEVKLTYHVEYLSNTLLGNEMMRSTNFFVARLVFRLIIMGKTRKLPEVLLKRSRHWGLCSAHSAAIMMRIMMRKLTCSTKPNTEIKTPIDPTVSG